MTLFEKEMKDPEFARLMVEEIMILEFTEKIVELMKREKVSKSELAKRLNKSEKYITKLLNGDEDCTIKTVADIFHALKYYGLKIKEYKYITPPPPINKK